MMKYFFIFLFLFLSTVKANDIEAPWIYFDLGNTIIDVRNPGKIDYFDGGKKYLEKLKNHGYMIGLITNIPETWGNNYDEKLMTLKRFVEKNWNGEIPFDWDQFDNIILPLTDKERKPAPDLFLKAIEYSGRCPIAYMSENLDEIQVATQMGLAAYLIMDGDRKEYVTLDVMKNFLQDNYHLKWGSFCFDEILFI